MSSGWGEDDCSGWGNGSSDDDGDYDAFLNAGRRRAATDAGRDSDDVDDNVALLTRKADEACNEAGMQNIFRQMYRINIAASVIQERWREWRAARRRKEMKDERSKEEQQRRDALFSWAEEQRRGWERNRGPAWRPNKTVPGLFSSFEAMDWGERSECLWSAAKYAMQRGAWVPGDAARGGMSEAQMRELLALEAGWRSAVGGGGGQGFTRFEYMSWVSEELKREGRASAWRGNGGATNERQRYDSAMLRPPSPNPPTQRCSSSNKGPLRPSPAPSKPSMLLDSPARSSPSARRHPTRQPVASPHSPTDPNSPSLPSPSSSHPSRRSAARSTSLSLSSPNARPAAAAQQPVSAPRRGGQLGAAELGVGMGLGPGGSARVLSDNGSSASRAVAREKAVDGSKRSAAAQPMQQQRTTDAGRRSGPTQPASTTLPSTAAVSTMRASTGTLDAGHGRTGEVGESRPRSATTPTSSSQHHHHQHRLPSLRHVPAPSSANVDVDKAGDSLIAEASSLLSPDVSWTDSPAVAVINGVRLRVSNPPSLRESSQGPPLSDTNETGVVLPIHESAPVCRRSYEGGQGTSEKVAPASLGASLASHASFRRRADWESDTRGTEDGMAEVAGSRRPPGRVRLGQVRVRWEEEVAEAVGGVVVPPPIGQRGGKVEAERAAMRAALSNGRRDRVWHGRERRVRRSKSQGGVMETGEVWSSPFGEGGPFAGWEQCEDVKGREVESGDGRVGALLAERREWRRARLAPRRSKSYGGGLMNGREVVGGDRGATLNGPLPVASVGTLPAPVMMSSRLGSGMDMDTAIPVGHKMGDSWIPLINAKHKLRKS